MLQAERQKGQRCEERHKFGLFPEQRERKEKSLVNRAVGVVVSHPLSMREALGSIPRLSIVLAAVSQSFFVNRLATGPRERSRSLASVNQTMRGMDWNLKNE